MEEYEDVERNALIAYNAADANDATAATMDGHEEEAESQNLMIRRQLEGKIVKNQLGNPRVLKATSGNAAKRKTKVAETRHVAKKRSTSLTATALKIIAKRGTDEKSQLENWKADLLDKLTSEIAQIHKAHDIAMEAQREELENQREQFQFEIQILRERIRGIELEKERIAQARIGRPEVVQKSLEKEIAQSPREEDAQPSQIQTPKTKQKRTYASVANAKPVETPTQPWTKVTYGNRKIGTTPATKIEPRGRRILFFRKSEGQLKSEADIMLALNKALQKAGVEPNVCFSRVQYHPDPS